MPVDPLESAMTRLFGGAVQHLNRLRIKYPDKDVSISGLAPQFVGYHASQCRIEVAFCSADGVEYERKRGTVGMTTGWKPSYMLILRSNPHGSMYLLGPNDRVTGIRRNRVWELF